MSEMSPLRGLPPFDRTPPEVHRAAARLAVPLALRTGKALYYQGDRPDTVWLLLGGSLRCVMYRSDESSLDMGRSGRGDWAGLAEVLLNSPCLNDAIAEEACELSCFPRAGFLRLLDLPGVRQFFLIEMARRFYTLHSRIELSQPLDRLVHFLLERCTAQDGEASCTQEEIAAAVGVTRETVNRHLARLQDEGLVRVGRGSIRIMEKDKLRERGGDHSSWTPA